MNRLFRSIGRRFGIALAGMALVGGTANAAEELELITTVILPAGSSWNFLHITNNVNPAVADPDFNDTWFKNDGSYNGPAFTGPSSAPFHYGLIEGLSGGTVLPLPPIGNRNTNYFTTSFNFAGNPSMVTNLMANLLVDDGIYIYLNGARVGGLNMPVGGADTFTSLTLVSNNIETVYANVDLVNNLTTGLNYLAVSVHQSSSTTSDMGLEFRLDAVLVIPEPAAGLAGLAALSAMGLGARRRRG